MELVGALHTSDKCEFVCCPSCDLDSRVAGSCCPLDFEVKPCSVVHVFTPCPTPLSDWDARHHSRPTGLGDVTQRLRATKTPNRFLGRCVLTCCPGPLWCKPPPRPFKELQNAFTFRIRICFSKAVWSVLGAKGQHGESGFSGICEL